jgi:hypothetical protein
MTGVPWQLHHLGVACHSLTADAAALAPLGYAAESPPFEDDRQGIAGQFFVGPGARLELLVNLPGRHILDPWLGRGSAVYHQAFEVPSLAEALEDLRRQGAKVAAPPAPAVAFGMREIAFLLLRNLLLIELIQMG